MEPDSLVEYVRSLDRRYNRLLDAILDHRAEKQANALPGSIDAFDRELWDIADQVLPTGN